MMLTLDKRDFWLVGQTTNWRNWSIFSFKVDDKSWKDLINIWNNNGPTPFLTRFLENLSHIGSHQNLAEDQAWSRWICFCLEGGWRNWSTWKRILSIWWISSTCCTWRIWNTWSGGLGGGDLFAHPLASNVEASASVADAHLRSNFKSKCQMS